MIKASLCKGLMLVALVAAGVACTTDTAQNEGNKPVIVSTTSLLDDLSRAIGGDLFVYESLMGPGVDPHIYKPTQGDLKKLQSADMVIYNGLHLEGKMGEIFQKMQRNTYVLSVGDSIPQKLLINNTEFEDGFDPHIWFDRDLWYMCAIRIAENMKYNWPDYGLKIDSNLNVFAERLFLMDVEVRNMVAEIPAERRVIITSHDALNYYARKYDFQVRSLQGSSTATELGLKDITAMVDYLVTNNITAIFPENITGDQSLQAVINGCEKKGHTVKMGAELFSDALGGPDSEAPDYFAMVLENTRRIVNALK
jgi:manganese/zinc/iron transport system substrate-binding protein